LGTAPERLCGDEPQVRELAPMTTCISHPKSRH
jgi:hypothetical protein